MNLRKHRQIPSYLFLNSYGYQHVINKMDDESISLQDDVEMKRSIQGDDNKIQNSEDIHLMINGDDMRYKVEGGQDGVEDSENVIEKEIH